MTLNALATVAAATAAGYVLQTTDSARVTRSGTSEVDRWTATLEKNLTGDVDGGSGALFTATGVGTTSTTAKAQAILSLDGHRLHRYGADSTVGNLGKRASAVQTEDVC